ncbi:hypothetical protein [Arsenophonus apicola]|uniref:Uncharacterized protein n=1 Tax=Arsenophonus apicola TaxID=2879119 RepID=A0ABY8P0E4_9GAMM|nr:hypothetical protein [Arsenophonus apicola]WGO82950.1 hypothetical protein QG404_11435 [Arsenophonus apicola]
MEITSSRITNINPIKLDTDNENNNKLKKDKSVKQILDEKTTMLISSDKETEIIDHFTMMNTMTAQHAENIRNTLLKKTISSDILVDILNLINAADNNMKHLNNITGLDYYVTVKDKIDIKNLRLEYCRQQLMLLKKDEQKYKIIKNEIIGIENDIEVCSKVLLIAEKSSRVHQLSKLGFSINTIPIFRFFQALCNIIEKNFYYSLSADSSKAFVYGLDNIITLIDQTDKYVSAHYLNMLEALYENKLKSIVKTPIHFNKEDIIQHIITLNVEGWQNKTVAEKAEVYEMINAANKIIKKLNSSKSTINPEIETLNIYAISVLASIYETDAHVFGKLSLEDITLTEYVYSYKDQNGRTQVDTTTIYEYMLRHIQEIDSPLSKRDHIKLKFPAEFQPGLIYYLEEECENIKANYYIIKNFQKLEQEVNDINKLMPSSVQYLTDFLSDLSDKYRVLYLSLTDEVDYKITRKGFGYLNTFDPVSKYKKFTIYDILTGRDKKYISNELGFMMYNLDRTFPNKYNKKIIEEIDSFDVQTDYINNIEELKNNGNMKNKFYHYIDTLLNVYNNKNKHYYLIENSPSLLVYAQREIMDRTGNDPINYQNLHPENTPISVISTITGQRLQFSSLRDMKNQIKDNKEISDWFNYHFPVTHKMVAAELRLIKKDKDYSYLYENILEMYLADIDVLVFSQSENSIFNIFEHIKLFILPAFFMGPVAGFLYGSLITVLPSFGQAANSDTLEERNNYLNQAAFAMGLEVAGGISLVVLKKIISKAATLYAKTKLPKQVFVAPNNILDDLSNYGMNRTVTASLVLGMKKMTLQSQNIDILNSTNTMSYIGLAPRNRIREAIRSNMLAGTKYETAELYIADILKQANVITELQERSLIENLKRAKYYTDFLRNSDLFNDVQKITTIDDLLQIKQGQLVVFTKTVANADRPVHAMVSVGNGRFAGIKNSLLDASLGDGKKIITAEQLGQFEGSILKHSGSLEVGGLNVWAGYPKGAKYSYGQPIDQVAKDLVSEAMTDSAKCIAELLERSGELSSEQALVFYGVAKSLYSSSNHQKALQQLMTNQKQINHYSELASLPKGSLVAFHENNYSVKKLMVSLGDGKFAIRHADRLELIFGGNFTQLADGKFGSYQVTAGKVNLSAMRQASLLGKDSMFGLKGNKLLIRAHGAPSIINYMDSIEFANVVKGLMLRAEDTIDLRSVGAIELQSCFGAFGRYPSGQVLANELGKKVTAYPLAYSKKIAQNPQWWRPYPKTFMPASDLNFIQQWLINQQHMRNYNFWNKLLGLYKKVTMTNSRLARAVEHNKADSIIESLTHDIAKLVLKKISIEDFLQLHAEYYSDGLTEVSPAVIKLALETLLAKDTPSDEQSFAEQIIAVFSLNRYSFQLLDNYLSNI